MRRADLRRLPLVAIVLMAASVVAVAVQEPGPIDERVQQLYASAEYEEALTLVANSNDPAAHLYRALCLLALGRQQETDVVLKSLVLAWPEFRVTADEVPPRFVALLTETRREVLPGILRRLFAEGREQYQAKAYDHAIARFEKVLAVSSAADVRDMEGLADLRVLAAGFVDLAKTPAPQASTPAVAASAPTSQPTSPPVRPTTTGPVAVRQDIPRWPAEAGRMVPATSGAVRVQISSSGRVTSATIIKGIHPRYDLRLLTSTSFWEYTPATINGVPIASESTVNVQVNR